MQLLKNKNIFITGGSKGIGKEMAYTMAKHGANIAFSYNTNIDKANEVKNEIGNKFSVKCHCYKCDASKFDETQDLAETILKDFGKIDILVNNAGITKDGLFLRMSEKDWDTVIDNNLKSVFNNTKAVIRHFAKNRSGVIINISSIVGQKGNIGQVNYSSSKSGILGFTKSIALEFGSRGIRCNAIAPGFIETDMTNKLNSELKEQWKKHIPLQRMGSVKEVADCAVFLASDMSSYITGQTINVNGGL